jgi:hypothetical protein
VSYERYGQWWSYVVQLRANLAQAERLIATAATDPARALQQRRIDACRAGLAEMERAFPDAA